MVMMSNDSKTDRRKNLRRALWLVFVFAALPFPRLTAAAADDWSGWRPTNDDRIQYHVRLRTFGALTPVCEFEFRAKVDRASFDFRYEVAYEHVGMMFPGAGKRSGYAAAIRDADQHRGGDSISGCKDLNSIAVTSIVERGDPASRVFARPSIAGVQLEPGCVKLLELESDRLAAAGAAKKLLAWSPLVLLAGESNAVHVAITITQTDWTELGASLGRVNKLALSTLALDAKVHAESGEHNNNPKAKAFWNAMADFYTAHAAGQ